MAKSKSEQRRIAHQQAAQRKELLARGPAAIVAATTGEPRKWFSLEGETVRVRYPEYRQILEECMQILDTKGEDYTEGNRDIDRLFNFRTQAADAGLTMEQVWMVFFGKHLSAIKSYCKRGKVESEPIRERIKDAINYLLLLSLMVGEREAK